MSQQALSIRNANVITMDPSLPRAEALSVHDGRITAIGAWEDVAPLAQGLPTLDLKGGTVIPGMIDTHAHFLWTALSLGALDVSEARDHDTLGAIVSQAAAQAEPGQLIFGTGFTEYTLGTALSRPIIDVLDEAAPENPVFLIGVTGHASALNSSALEALALPPEIAGVMRSADGKPRGMLADEANNKAGAYFSHVFGADAKAAERIDAAVDTAHSVGITTLHALEGGLTGGDASVAQFFDTIPELPLRILLYYQTMDVQKVLEMGLPRIGGCILLDGDVGPRTAALSEPYIDDPDCCGTLYHTQEEIDAFVLASHEAGLQVALHAVGDAAVQQALNAYEAALTAAPRDDHRHRIEHCEVMREDQVRRAQRLGVALGIQPPFNHFWAHTTYYASLGQQRAWRADPVRTLVRPDLLVAGGSDSTVTPLNPLLGVHAAVNHSNPAQRITVHEAFTLYTLDAARIGFTESDTGSLEVGKFGDLVVLGDDPFDIDPRRIKDIPVLMTILGGQVVFSNGRPHTRERIDGASA